MAELIVAGTDLVVRLSPLERLGAFRGDVRVPVEAVSDLRAIDDLWPYLRGIRAPGTGIRGVISLGTRRGGGITDFAAVYGHRPGIVVDLRRNPLSRLVVSCRDAADQNRRMVAIAAAVNQGSSHGPEHIPPPG